MTLDLMIFIIVAAVAIFSAAFMLISRNAVHSVLFLVTNFICVAFFYLMLNAPFLGMIQITVYAGAIMVLFMFVVMLLGAERLGMEQPRYPWLAPVSAGLATILLVVAFIVIVQGNVGLLQPITHPPQVRVVHAAAGMPAVQIYVDDTPIAPYVGYRNVTNFVEAKAGQSTLLVFPACTEQDRTKCPDPIQSGASPFQAMPISLDGNTYTTLVLAGTLGNLQTLIVPTDLSTPDNDNSLRLTAVNALPGDTPVNLVRMNPAFNPNQPASTPVPAGTPLPAGPTNRMYDVLVTNLKYGTVSQPLTLSPDTDNLAWMRGDTERIAPLANVAFKSQTHEVLILAPEIPAGQQTARPTVIRIDPPMPTQIAFGSPQQIGSTLFSSYLLPFELLSVLLLAAMVGAIILTREEIVKRVRERLVVSPAIRRLNRAIATPTGTKTETTSEALEAETEVK